MKRIFTFLTALLITASVFAQTPEKMSYQAVIRNSSAALVINTTVGMRISILQGSASGTVVYTETQMPTTNANGLVSIEIGGGVGFSTIDWATGIYFIKTETDPTGGTNYTITGTSQLLSVPYALAANESNHAIKADSSVHAKTATNLTLPFVDTINSFGVNAFEIYNSSHYAIKGTGIIGVWGDAAPSGGTPIGVRGTGYGVNARGGLFEAPLGYAIIAGSGRVLVADYTQLGSNAPPVKMKKLIGSTAATQGGTATFPHGLDASKILGVTVLVRGSVQSYVPPSYTGSGNFEYDYFFDGANFYIINKSGNSAALLSKPYTVLITYEE